MATTRDDIREWFKKGKREGASHLFVVCDTFSLEDYPVYVKKAEAQDKFKKYLQGKYKMQKLMEIYNLSQSLEEQLRLPRSFNL